ADQYDADNHRRVRRSYEQATIACERRQTKHQRNPPLGRKTPSNNRDEKTCWQTDKLSKGEHPSSRLQANSVIMSNLRQPRDRHIKCERLQTHERGYLPSERRTPHPVASRLNIGHLRRFVFFIFPD